jgi:predicted nucleic acid-binding protein
LLEGRISAEVRTEVLRNVTAKLPAALPHLRVLLDAALVEGAAVTDEQVEAMAAYADPKDQPILASAVAQSCRYLVTLNEKDFWPPSELIVVVRPGALLQMLRTQLAGL